MVVLLLLALVVFFQPATSTDIVTSTVVVGVEGWPGIYVGSGGGDV